VSEAFKHALAATHEASMNRPHVRAVGQAALSVDENLKGPRTSIIGATYYISTHAFRNRQNLVAHEQRDRRCRLGSRHPVVI
jgi:hypothetical protein